MGDNMFEEKDRLEDNMQAVANFLTADVNLRNALINNIMREGVNSLDNIGTTLSDLLRKKEF